MPGEAADSKRRAGTGHIRRQSCRSGQPASDAL